MENFRHVPVSLGVEDSADLPSDLVWSPKNLPDL
jgi:hypothetical protein